LDVLEQHGRRSGAGAGKRGAGKKGGGEDPSRGPWSWGGRENPGGKHGRGEIPRYR